MASCYNPTFLGCETECQPAMISSDPLSSDSPLCSICIFGSVLYLPFFSFPFYSSPLTHHGVAIGLALMTLLLPSGVTTGLEYLILCPTLNFRTFHQSSFSLRGCFPGCFTSGLQKSYKAWLVSNLLSCLLVCVPEHISSFLWGKYLNEIAIL